jgi:hypothetical protein
MRGVHIVDGRGRWQFSFAGSIIAGCFHACRGRCSGRARVSSIDCGIWRWFLELLTAPADAVVAVSPAWVAVSPPWTAVTGSGETSLMRLLPPSAGAVMAVSTFLFLAGSMKAGVGLGQM